MDYIIIQIILNYYEVKIFIYYIFYFLEKIIHQKDGIILLNKCLLDQIRNILKHLNNVDKDG